MHVTSQAAPITSYTSKAKYLNSIYDYVQGRREGGPTLLMGPKRSTYSHRTVKYSIKAVTTYILPSIYRYELRAEVFIDYENSCYSQSRPFGYHLLLIYTITIVSILRGVSFTNG